MLLLNLLKCNDICHSVSVLLPIIISSLLLQNNSSTQSYVHDKSFLTDFSFKKNCSFQQNHESVLTKRIYGMVHTGTSSVPSGTSPMIMITAVARTGDSDVVLTLVEGNYEYCCGEDGRQRCYTYFGGR